ncbi:phosphoribosylaminoimidazolesuccinocarboxamide synthase [Candidatus Pacearchaeota archaeon]|nr:phosphoribosylaminoimidazolesuccinocarboxamide synthase [Candidatus Pacearchaeota archaeon]
MGSVKELIILKEPDKDSLGEGIFVFSNRFSILDWGKMPDEIPNKGAALCMMAAANFEDIRGRITDSGEKIETHYLGIREGGKIVEDISALSKPSNEMAIRVAEAVKPFFKIKNGYDYGHFQKNRGKGNFVVPLEVIYRNGITEGSSLLKKLRGLENEGKTEELSRELVKLGTDHIPVSGEMFPNRVYDFTTKFESSDRTLTYEEAKRISGLTDEQWNKLTEVRGIAADVISERAKKSGMVDYDGKLEFISFYENLMLADVLGTFDENRLTFNGVQIGKEVLRQHYRKTQPDWIEQIEEGKSQAKREKTEDWKQFVSLRANKLPPRLVELVGEMYAAGANQYLAKDWFRARDLDKVLNDLGNFN